MTSQATVSETFGAGDLPEAFKLSYIKQEVEVTNVYRRNEAATAKTVVNVGGAGSSKTHSTLQLYLFNRLLKPIPGIRDYRLLVGRLTRASIKHSVHKKFIDLLKQYGIYNENLHNQSDLIYTFPETGYEVQFSGLDALTNNSRSQKSAEYHDILLEEANEIPREGYLFSLTRLYRGEIPKAIDPKTKKDITFKPQVRLNLNPEECWVHDLEKENRPDVQFIYSTYKDNNFVNQEYVNTLEGLATLDKAYHLIYARGKWAQKEGLIFTHFVEVETFPEAFEYEFYGIDRGFTNPSVLLHIGVIGDAAYVTEQIYETQLTSQMFRNEMKTRVNADQKRRCPVYCPPEEVEFITELRGEGYNAVAANNDVTEGIDTVKSFKVYTLKSNTNFNKEARIYKWRKDLRNGILVDVPVKFMDHGMDAVRYGLHTHKKTFKNLAAIKEQLKANPKDLVQHGEEYESGDLFNT